jgi:uncharacterized protein YndB with AHSA1/START domain
MNTSTLDKQEAFGVVTAPRTVRLERILPGPIERVWAYLTEPEKRAKWMASGPMADFVGGPVEFNFDLKTLSGEPTPERFKKYEQHTLRGVITHYDPPHKLGYTWGDGDAPSEVTMELMPAAAGSKPGSVLLIVTHQKLSSREGMISVSSGWHTHLGTLGDELGGEARRPFWDRLLQVEQTYEKQIPGLS